jgi:threonine synthase
MTGDDTAEMHKLMSGFEETTKLQPSEALVAACRKEMVSARVTDEEILETIRDVHARTSDSYTLDPHSAIGVAAARKIGKTAGVPMVCLACAHWAKFPDANQAALGEQVRSSSELPCMLRGGTWHRANPGRPGRKVGGRWEWEWNGTGRLPLHPPTDALRHFADIVGTRRA